MMLWIFFFLSGLAALVYEILWVRELILVFGATNFAVATVLSAFMGGLALGSRLLGKRADRLSRPLQTYAFLEIGIGLYALIIHPLFGALVPVYQLLWNHIPISFYVFSLVRFILVSSILLVPTTCMGGTLPLLASYSARRGSSEGSVAPKVGGLYAVNTAGAVVGVLLCGFLLLPTLGTARTTLSAAAVNLLIGAGAILLSRKENPPVEVVRKKRAASAVSPPPRTALLLTFALCGFAAMVYEVAWTRLLTQILGSTVYSFTTLLATFLFGLAAGSALFSFWLPYLRQPLKTLGLIQGATGLLAFGGEYLFGRLPEIFTGLIGLLHSAQRYLSGAKFLIAALVMFPATFLMGATFPVILGILVPRSAGAGREVGEAYAFNTVGTILGSFFAGFFFLPFLGMQHTLLLAISINLALAVGLLLVAAASSPVRGWVAGGALAVITIGFFSGPTWDPLALSADIFGKAESMDLLFYQEGLTAAVTVSEHPTLAEIPHLTMTIDGKPNASTASDMPTQVLVAQLPLFLHPRPERAMVIGLGSAITLGSAIQHPLKEIIAVELEPAVVKASHYFDPFNNRPLEDPRVHLLVDDARNYLLVSPETFDVIISEPSHPWRSGSSKLFTREFFDLGRRHLAPKGIFAQWIHFYGIKPPELKGVVRTFQTVFPHVLVFYTPAGDLILLGRVEPFEIDPVQIGSRMANPRVSFELSRVNVDSVYDLFAYFILDTEEVISYTGPGPLNTDDDTFVEFQTPKSLFEDTLSIHLAEMNQYAAGAARLLVEKGAPAGVLAEAETQMAASYQKKDRLRDGERAIQRALQVEPSATRYYRLGRILEEMGRESDARGAYSSALAQDPGHPETLIEMIRFEQERGDLLQMGNYITRLKQARPNDPLLAYYEGIDLYYHRRPADALRELDRAGIRGGPLAQYYRSRALAELSRHDEEQAALRRFFEELNQIRKRLEGDPKRFNTLPVVRASKLRAQRGVRIPEEERLYQLFDRVVGQPVNHLYSGMGLYMLGLFRESSVELSASLQGLGEKRYGSLAEFYLGLCDKRLGKYKEATLELNEFLSAGGDGGFRVEEARKNLQEILRIQAGGVTR